MELKSPFKLSLIFLLVATPSTLVLAQSTSPCNFNGFTLGLGLGATTFMSETSSSATLTSAHPSFEVAGLLALPPPTPGNNVNYSANNNIWRYGAMGTLYAGYGYVTDRNVYLGTELGLNFFGARDTSQKNNAGNNIDVSASDTSSSPSFDFINDLNINNSLNSKTTVTRHSIEPYLDVKLGYLLTPSMLAYVKGGINYNTIKVKTNSSYQSNAILNVLEEDQILFSHSGSGAATLGNSNSSNGIGWRAGIGMEVMLTPQLGVGGDYVYTFYKKVKTTAANGVGRDVACDAQEGCQIVSADLSNSDSARVYDQEVMAQLIYHFG